MPRMIILSLALIVLIVGLTATEITPSASATTTQPVCQADPTSPDVYEVVTGKHVRPDTCVVTQSVDESFSIVAIQAIVTKDWLAATDSVRIWTNFSSIEQAKRFACTLVKGTRLTHPGYLVATDLRCFTAMVIGVVRY